MANLADINLWINGWPLPTQGYERTIPLQIAVDPAHVTVGGDGGTVESDVTIAGGAQPVAATVGIGGGAPVQAAVETEFTKPLAATVSAALRSLPDIVLRLKEIPKFQLEAPSHLR